MPQLAAFTKELLFNFRHYVSTIRFFFRCRLEALNRTSTSNNGLMVAITEA